MIIMRIAFDGSSKGIDIQPMLRSKHVANWNPIIDCMRSSMVRHEYSDCPNMVLSFLKVINNRIVLSFLGTPKARKAQGWFLASFPFSHQSAPILHCQYMSFLVTSSSLREIGYVFPKKGDTSCLYLFETLSQVHCLNLPWNNILCFFKTLNRSAFCSLFKCLMPFMILSISAGSYVACFKTLLGFTSKCETKIVLKRLTPWQYHLKILRLNQSLLTWNSHFHSFFLVHHSYSVIESKLIEDPFSVLWLILLSCENLFFWKKTETRANLKLSSQNEPTFVMVLT